MTNINFNPARLLGMEHIALQMKKKEQCCAITVKVVSLGTKLSDVARRLEIRTHQKSAIAAGSSKEKEMFVKCRLGLDKDWLEAMDYLCLNDVEDGPLSSIDLIQIASQMQSINAVSVLSALVELGWKEVPSRSVLNQVEDQMVRYLPILITRNSKKSLAINLYEMCTEFDGQMLHDMLIADTVVSSATQQQSSSPPSNRVTAITAGKRGRKCKHEKFPLLVQTVLDYLREHSFSAQERRRNNVATSSGVSLKNIRDHVLEKVEGLKKDGISRQTVAHLMLAPRRKTRNAKLYKGLIKARVPAKNNSGRKYHDDAHFCNSEVSYMMELGQKFQDEVHTYSCDDKNKLNVGDTVLAVGRYVKIQSFFMEDDAPLYMDHDHVSGASKLNPCGYMKLQHKKNVRKPRSQSLPPKDVQRPDVQRSR